MVNNTKLSSTNSNFRIFLNLENYPQSTVDPEYIPSDIDNASVDAFFNFKLIPGNNVPDQNLNGWQDAIDFSANVNISNNSDVLKERDSNCYVNWSSLCIIDFTNMLAGDDYSIPTPYSEELAPNRFSKTSCAYPPFTFFVPNLK